MRRNFLSARCSKEMIAEDGCFTACSNQRYPSKLWVNIGTSASSSLLTSPAISSRGSTIHCKELRIPSQSDAASIPITSEYYILTIATLWHAPSPQIGDYLPNIFSGSMPVPQCCRNPQVIFPYNPVTGFLNIGLAGPAI
ncbi:hypothetical protein BV898_10936 [Hypsibius exemplaris]|uniref:Uncharacterized protein n=1 Tax=Hypsibius exemplaris TaxID=2072580 RepID=A0A1W0WI66_HYPEX|nr:hypothetical protein BV898_10936 [Hypsibius exemplaris]